MSLEHKISAMISDLESAKKEIVSRGGFFPSKPLRGGRQVTYTATGPSTVRSRARKSEDLVGGPSVTLAKAARRAPRKSLAPASQGGVLLPGSVGGEIPQFTGTEGGAIPQFTGTEGGVLLPSAIEVKSSRGGVRGTGGRKAAAAANPWLAHVAATRAAHPGMSYREAMSAAKSTYRK